MAHIRPLALSDKEPLLHIFRSTAHADLKKGGDKILNIASYIWCRPYHLLAPGTSFVIDDGTGRAIGYILSVADTAAFVAWYRTTYLPYCNTQGIDPPDGTPSWNENLAGALKALVYKPEEMLHRRNPKLLEEYPAHLHVDILPECQRQGWGRKLMDVLVEELRRRGVRGVHLGMAGSNVAAGRFYEALGFERFGEVMDGGKSGEVGREEGGGIVYVRKL